MRKLITACAVVLLAAGIANAQTYKVDYATKLVLAGGTTDPTNTLTLKLASNTAGGLTWTLPASGGGNGYVLTTDGSAPATLSWTNLSSLGITSIVGTAPINANTVSGTTTISITHGDLTTSGTGLSVTGGTGAVIGSGAQVSLATGALSVPGIFTTTGTGVMAGSTFSIGLASETANTFFAAPDGSAGTPTFRTITAGDIATALSTGGNAGSFTTLTSSGNSTLGTTSSATNNSFGTGGNANNVMNTIGSTGTGSMTTINGGVTLASLTAQPGVVHNSNTGVLSSSGVATADIINANVTYAKIQNVGASSLFGNSTGAGATGQDITLDPSLMFTASTPGAKLAINTANPNNWSGLQTISGAGNFKYTGNGEAAGYVLTSDANGVASWQNLSGLGVTSVVGTAPINVNTVSGVATVSITHGDLTVSGTGLGVTGGGGAAIGSGAQISLTTGALTGSGALGFSGGGVVVGSATSLALTTDATLTQAGSSLGIALTNPNIWQGQQSFGAVVLTRDATAPVAVNPTQDDWALSGSKSFFNVTAAAGGSTVTSIAGGVDGRVIVLVNTGANAIALVNEGGSGTVANKIRIGGGGPAILTQDGTATLIYDGSISRWRLIATY